MRLRPAEQSNNRSAPVAREHLTYPILVEYPQILLLVSRNLSVDTVGVMSTILGRGGAGSGEREEAEEESADCDHVYTGESETPLRRLSRATVGE